LAIADWQAGARPGMRGRTTRRGASNPRASSLTDIVKYDISPVASPCTTKAQGHRFREDVFSDVPVFVADSASGHFDFCNLISEVARPPF